MYQSRRRASSRSSWRRIWMFLSLPFFVKVRLSQIINYLWSSSSSSRSHYTESSCSTDHNCQSVGPTASDDKREIDILDKSESCKNSRKRFGCFDFRNHHQQYKLVGKMAHFLSRTMAVFSIAFVVHFIIMTTLAEKEFSSLSMRRHRRDFELDEARRQPRSYRSEKDASKSAAASNNVAPLAAARPPDRTSDALFATENSTVITAQIGSTANLPCIVKNLGNGVASWIRRHDYHLLTVGMGTYSNDDRFYVSHNRPNQNWELHLKFVKPSDEGVYECQISTHPPSSIFINLRVVEAKAEILGEPDKHVRSGSTFELVCVLRDSTEPPVYVFWYHNDRMINYDNERGVVVSSDVEKSILTIQEAHKSDSGNYTCQPSNASPSWIVVHILNGEKPAAMQHGSRSDGVKCLSSSSPTSLILVLSLLSFLITTWLTMNSNLHTSKPHQSQQNYRKHHQNQYQCQAEDEEETEEDGGCPTNHQQIQIKERNKKSERKPRTTEHLSESEKARIQITTEKPEPSEAQSESQKASEVVASRCLRSSRSSTKRKSKVEETTMSRATHSETTDSHNFGFGERQRIFPPYDGGPKTPFPTATTFPTISSTKVTSPGCSVASLDADLNSSCFPQLSSAAPSETTTSSTTSTTLSSYFPTTSPSSYSDDNDGGMGKEAVTQTNISCSSRRRNSATHTTHDYHHYSYQNFTSVVGSAVER